MAAVTIYHNPRCSKSRQTLDLIRGNGVEPEVVEYLKEPPTAAEIKEILGQLNMQAKDIVRTKEDLFKELSPNLEDEDSLIKVLSENPKLIERPIVVSEGKAVLGRPPENVLEIL